MTPLCALAQVYKCDKLYNHNYTPIYYDMLQERTQSIKRVLEIGIGNPGHAANGFPIGASLRMWEKFFPNADILGFDWSPVAMINEGRISSYYCNQSNLASLQDTMSAITAEFPALEGGGTFDLIIDDGSHKAEDQILSLGVLLPYLTRDGIYVVEDVYYTNTVGVVASVPKNFSTKVVCTGDKPDDILIVIRHAPAS